MKRPPLMSHADRRRIIDAPFLALGVHNYGRSYPWAGVLIERELIESSTRRRSTEGALDGFRNDPEFDQLWNEL